MSSNHTSTKYKISIVIPVYEQPELLEEALKSVDKQTIDDYEVIVVDDASQTDHRPIVEEYERSRLIVHDKNRGAAAARNTGINASQGDFVAFLDADDIWKPTKIEKQLSVFENGGDDLGLVYTGFVQYELDGSTWERYPQAHGNIYREELERDRVHPTSTVMVQRGVFDDVGGFDINLPSRQDYDLWIRITECYEVDYVNAILVDKREQSDSISKNFKKRIKGDIAVFEKVKQRAAAFNFLTRSMILSYHHHVIGRDYDSIGNQSKALKHLGIAIIKYPFRPISYAMFIIALFRIDRNGRLMTFIKQFIR